MVTQPIKLERTTEAEPAALARKPGAYVRAQCCYLILALAALMIAVHIVREGTLVAARGYGDADEATPLHGTDYDIWELHGDELQRSMSTWRHATKPYARPMLGAAPGAPLQHLRARLDAIESHVIPYMPVLPPSPLQHIHMWLDDTESRVLWDIEQLVQAREKAANKSDKAKQALTDILLVDKGWSTAQYTALRDLDDHVQGTIEAEGEEEGEDERKAESICSESDRKGDSCNKAIKAAAADDTKAIANPRRPAAKSAVAQRAHAEVGEAEPQQTRTQSLVAHSVKDKTHSRDNDTMPGAVVRMPPLSLVIGLAVVVAALIAWACFLHDACAYRFQVRAAVRAASEQKTADSPRHPRSNDLTTILAVLLVVVLLCVAGYSIFCVAIAHEHSRTSGTPSAAGHQPKRSVCTPGMQFVRTNGRFEEVWRNCTDTRPTLPVP